MSDREYSNAVEVAEEGEELEAPRAGGPLALALRRLLRKKIAVAALAFIAVFYFCGIFAPWVAPRSFTDQDLDNVRQGPSLEHPLGTDVNGRDMLSRVIWACPC
jgi:peptide/nickel transport system permease protein